MVKVNRKKRALCLATGIISGFLLGICSLGSLISYRIDNYLTSIKKLENTIEDRDLKLEKMQESLEKVLEEAKVAKEKKLLVKDIEVILDYEGSEINKIEFEKAVKDKYRHLIGADVENLNTDTIGQIVDKRIFHGDGKDYRLAVTRLYISRIIKIWIRIEER